MQGSHERKRKPDFPKHGIPHQPKRSKRVYNVTEDVEVENLPVYNVGDDDDELIKCNVGEWESLC